MATTWFQPTYAHKRYHVKTTIKRKIDYIIDRNKTTLTDDVDGVNEDTVYSILAEDNIENEQEWKHEEPEHQKHEEYEHQENQEQQEQTNATTIPAVSSISGYIQNPDKTENSELVTGYECFPEYADEQFATSMDLYERNTGRKHKSNSILVYHMRQSFVPGEVDPRIANQIAYELALEFTKSEHAFVVATHTDKSHIHNHVIINAFNLNCDGKFRDPWRSGKRHVARISDRLCKEYGLSVIEVKHGWRDPYNIWEQKQGITKEDKEPTKRRQLENVIALCLEKQPKDFKRLLKYLEDYSCYAKKRGRDISITAPFSKNPIRLGSLSEQFTYDGIIKQIEVQQNNSYENIEMQDNSFENAKKQNTENQNISKQNINNNQGTLVITKAPTKTVDKNSKSKFEIHISKPKELRLIIDIQNSLKATESVGYRKWAEKFNLEQMSQTLLFIEKHELSLEDLENIATQKPITLANIKGEIAAVDEKLQQISLLQRYIGTYGKTKEVYKQYKQSQTPEQFKQENMKAITDHEAAKAYFNEMGYGFRIGKRLPKIKELREQYARLNADKKSLWAKYHDIKNSDKEIDNAWANVRTLLNLKDDAKDLKEDVMIEQSEKNTPEKERKSPSRNAPNL